MRRIACGLAAFSLVLFGLWSLSGAATIHGKAWLAQVLLERAWSATLAGQQRERPWPWADTWPVARLQVPALAIDQIVLAGANGRTLAFGPALVDGTAAPGAQGHSILGGHRDTHFSFLQGLTEDMEIRLQDRSGRWHRFVARGASVLDTRHDVILPPDRGAPLLTLVTCYPFDAVRPGGPLRYAVTAEAPAAASR